MFRMLDRRRFVARDGCGAGDRAWRSSEAQGSAGRKWEDVSRRTSLYSLNTPVGLTVSHSLYEYRFIPHALGHQQPITQSELHLSSMRYFGVAGPVPHEVRHQRCGPSPNEPGLCELRVNCNYRGTYNVGFPWKFGILRCIRLSKSAHPLECLGHNSRLSPIHISFNCLNWSL